MFLCICGKSGLTCWKKRQSNMIIIADVIRNSSWESQTMTDREKEPNTSTHTQRLIHFISTSAALWDAQIHHIVYSSCVWERERQGLIIPKVPRCWKHLQTPSWIKLHVWRGSQIFSPGVRYILSKAQKTAARLKWVEKMRVVTLALTACPAKNTAVMKVDSV